MKKMILMCIMIIFVFTGKFQSFGQSFIGGIDLPVEDIESFPVITYPDDYFSSDRELPQWVDNSQSKYFPPYIIEQAGNSCAQASGIGYMFTYHINFTHDTDASLPEYQYPPGYTYNFLNNGQSDGTNVESGWVITENCGIPSVEDYGALYYANDYTKWMNGFDKYKNGMNNRVHNIYSMNNGTKENLLILKQYLYDCHGIERYRTDSDGNQIRVGGIVSYSQSVTRDPVIGILPDESEFAGQMMELEFLYDEVNPLPHRRTIVGYNDNVKYDFNNDGIITNNVVDDEGNETDIEEDLSNWEIGAFLVSDSGGDCYWNDGFLWIPYRLFSENQDHYINSIFTIEASRNYEPKLFLKANINFTNRDEIKIFAGISNDVSSTVPQHTIGFPILNHKGGPYGMKGIDQNTLEFGLDITNLFNYCSYGEEIRLFLCVEHQSDNQESSGEILSFSVFDELGNEYSSIGPSLPATILKNGITYAWTDLHSNLQPSEIYVDSDIGNDVMNDGSKTSPFKTISRALKIPGKSNTIYLTGEFHIVNDITKEVDELKNGIKISRSVSLVGLNSNTSIIQDDVSTRSRIFLIYGTGDENISIKNIRITNGNPSRDGGAIYAENIQSLRLENCVFKDNITSVTGGALYLKNIPQLSISNCEFLGNKCPLGNGSGVYIYNGDGNIAIIDNCKFIENGHDINFDTGGGVYIDQHNIDANSIEIKNSSFIRNCASNSGGAIYINQNNGCSESHINNCTFTENISEIGKGHAVAINSYNSDFKINSCTIIDNGIDAGSAMYFQRAPSTTCCFKVINSILSNPVTNLELSNLTETELLRSFTISNDASIPICSDPPEYNGYTDTEDLITPIKNEYGTYFYKVVPYSIAKDVIPHDALDSDGNPYNGAPITDQLGQPVLNINRDIGSYESPYYWIDTDYYPDNTYVSDPNMTINLHHADPYEDWEDFIYDRAEGTVWLQDATQVVRQEGSEFILYENSILQTDGNVRIINNLKIDDNAEIDIFNNSLLNLQYCDLDIQPTTIINLYNDSKLVVENGTFFSILNGANLNIFENAGIDVKNKAYFTAENTVFGNTDQWKGIYCASGSTVSLDNVEINNADIGLSGLPLTCSIQNSTFTNCNSGISVEGCTDLNINNNVLTGTETGTGTGISVTQKSGWITGNNVSGFKYGIMTISCTPYLMDNRIFGNDQSGLYVAGLNAVPTLIKPSDLYMPAYYLNNEIIDNGHVPTYPVPTVSMPGQICVLQDSRIYMQYGHNNVYFSPQGDTPAIPCMVAAKLVPEGEIPRIQLLNVQGNYWGASSVTDDFFVEGNGYSIAYDPYHTWPWGQIPSTSDIPEPDSKSFDLLMKAFEAELDGKYDKAIHFYEKIIEKYPGSDEAYVAYSKLPDDYNELEMDLEPLISLYDGQISADEDNRKFFKEMKVATHLKGKKFDDAIAISEEMKLEADCEEEEILCDIDIAIATLLKDDNKGRTSDVNSEDLRNLFAKLRGDELKNNSTDISETVLPSKTALHQNYPNPFNPITEIRFDLAKKGIVKLTVYNITGQKVTDLVNNVMNAGYHSVKFDGSRLNSGLYYYSLTIGDKTITKKMILTK